jgi:membrane protein
VQQRLVRIFTFLNQDLWQLQITDLPRPKAVLMRWLRIGVAVVRGFRHNQCAMWASSLTFYTLLSVVPVAAMAFGIAKGFGFEKLLERDLMARFSGQEEVLARIIDFARTLLDNTRGGVVAGIGVAVLFWSVIKVLSNIEAVFNHIWKVRARPWLRKLGDYLAIMLICPVLIILSSSVTVFITHQVTAITDQNSLLQIASPLITYSLKVLPFGLIWLLLTMVYMVMPNTRVRLLSALLAGVIAGTVYQLAQGAYITFQIGVARYNAIYGSFAALPLFLVWLQISWLIVLVGAEISCAHQKDDAQFRFPPDSHLNTIDRRLLSLYICHRIVRQFVNGGAPSKPAEIAQSLQLPVGLVQELLNDLVQANIISRTIDINNDEQGCQPAIDPDHISLYRVIQALDQLGGETSLPTPPAELSPITQALAEFSETILQSPANRLLQEL